MRTIRTKIYKFKELGKEAKQKAIEYYRKSETYDYLFDEAVETLKKFANIFSITIRDFDFLEPYRNRYTFEMEDQILELSGTRLATYIWNNFKSDIYKGKYYSKLVKTEKGGTPIEVSKEHPAGLRHVIHQSKAQINNSCVLTGVCYDQSILDPIYKFLERPDKSDFRDLLEDCLMSICKDLQSEIKARQEDKYIIEEIEANDYEFYRDGTMY